MAEIPKLFMVFESIPKPLIESLISEKDSNTRKELLISHLNLRSEGILKSILEEYHFNNLNYCIRNNFSVEKTSCLLEILKYTLEHSIAQRINQSSSFEVFKKLLLKHSVQRSPYSIAVFTVDDLKKILDYSIVSLFSHYSLYEYAFTPNCNLVVKNVTRFEGAFPMILKLEEGTEILPDTIPALEPFIIKPPIEDPPKEINSEEEEEATIADPLQYLLDREIKLIKLELDEKIRKQDEEFLSKIEVFKK
jgi:Flagellar C1a complex subunit C1a-32